jgi:starch-binding outer membrane protein, SusD/RagB family
MDKRQLAGPTRGRWARVMALTVLLSGCDLSVTNPGPVQDVFLDEQAAHPAIIYGAMRVLSDALGANGGGFAMCGGVVAREWFPSGQTQSFACEIKDFWNELVPENAGVVNRAQQARALAEQGTARIREARGDKFAQWDMAALALLYVGYSNRLLGEHVCRTVIDGGAEQKFTIHFERAEAAFTEAIDIARAQKNTTYEYAALAGRASVRIWRGNWTGAMADAALVPASFSYKAAYNALFQDQYNALYFSTTDQARRNFSQWHTFYGDNFDQFNDPRTPYRKYPAITAKVGLGLLTDLGDGYGTYGAIPYWQQRKYTKEDDGIELSSGREMQLLIAEGKLRAGDWQGALAIVNQIRTQVGVPVRQAATAEEAWTWVKLEKLIEIWLEGRAVGERRRWAGDGPDPAAPGPLPAYLRMDDRRGKDRCWPFSQSEIETNPNIS